ncbi:hypothetical protein GBA52_023340 [Prunus armeniaca]|nr:hypothetical protein GBA52_023340 [Prunus armeniaca]
MQNLSRRFSTVPIHKLLPQQLHQHQPQPTRFFIPFSEYQQKRKLLEHKLISDLDVCANLSQVKEVHAHLLRHGLSQCCYVLTKLVRTLTKLGVPVDAYPRLVFLQVKYPNPFLWTAMIRGYTVQGPISEALNFYTCMRSAGTGPVSFTFSALFKACGDVLDVNLGRQIHAQTILVGGFAADLYVGNTMIDMYVKCGFLDCGRKVFDEMPDRDVVSWTELIVAYTKIGDMGSARELFEGLPVKDMVAWTAMVTGYAQNARPRDALDCFERMQGAGVGTDEITLVGLISACAQLGASKYANWVRDIAEKSGETNHPEYAEIKKALDDLLNRLQAHGYQPNLNSAAYDLGIEERKRILMSHSEKLALAYALLSTDSGSTIKIMKNIRICEDCHVFMCGASQVAGREIVVRDNMRFHHFSNGKCSCGNFW